MKQSAKSGVALIVVLGFLSILILMAVALVTLTRTERLVSSYTAEGIRCRQLARGAIDRAIAELNHYMDVNKLVRILPEDAVFISLGNGGKVGPNTRMFRGSETNWLPWKYLVAPTPHNNVRSIWDNEAEWIVIRDPTNAVVGAPLGRIAFAIVDCTGLLDVNVLGSKTIRGGVYVNNPVRLSIADVGLEQLPEAVGDAAALAYNRACYHVFLTFREVLAFNDGAAGRYSCNERMVFNDMVGLRTVGPFSLSYDNGSWWDPEQWRWQKGLAGAVPNVNEWTEFQASTVFLQLLGVSAAVANQMAAALMDYRDADRLPRNTRSLCVEAVPMLNEFVLSGRVEVDGGANVRLIIQITPETWYPFPANPVDGAYQFPPGTPTISSTPGAGGFTLSVIAGGGPQAFGTVAPNNSAVIGPISYNNGSPQAWPLLVYTIPLPGVATGSAMRLAARMDLVQLANASGAIVDEAVGPRAWPTIPQITVPAAGGTVNFGPYSLGVNDPRLNHLANAWQAAGAGTPGALNGPGTTERALEGADMYVRDGNLESVAELGFICMSASELEPWRTIPLYSEGGKRLLAMFRTGANSWLADPVVWTNGFLNPNSHFSNVWDAVFYGVNLAQVPNAPTTNAWNNNTEIWALRNSIVNMLSVTQFYSGADWVVTGAMQPGGALGVAGLNNNQREAIIRNTHRLFSPNGNFYSVFVMAQTFQEGNTNVVSAEKRLAALVWHDPFPDNATRRRRWFIRWFRWLEE